MKNPVHPVRAAVLCLAALSFFAQAQSPKMVSREELRTCMNSEADLAARRLAMEPRNQKNRDEAAAIRAEAQLMSEEQKKVEEDPARMERFNRRVKAHNTRIEVANAEVAKFRADL